MRNQPDDEEEMQTVHIYVYEEEPKKSSDGILDCVVHRLVQLVALAMMGVFCLAPYTPVYAMRIIRVPAHILPIQVFRVQSPIVPTGKIEHSATQAHGTLTVYNGLSVIQQLPAGVIVLTRGGDEVATDQSVTIPAANLPSVGVATVPAHAVVAGSQGNISAGQVNQNYGSSITMRNLSAFQGGRDAYTEQVVTSDDTAKALEDVRGQLTMKIPGGLLAGPCAEKTAQDGNMLTVTWSCHYVTYTVPRNVKRVLSAHVEGKYVILPVRAIVRPE